MEGQQISGKSDGDTESGEVRKKGEGGQNSGSKAEVSYRTFL